MTSTTRRALLGAAMATALPSAPWADDRTARVAILTIADDGWRAGVVAELKKHGFVQGRNLQVDVRIAPAEAMPAVARDMVAQKPDVVVAVSDWALQAFRATDAPVPIVAAPMGADPVKAGVARSWANPGGNVTGVSILANELDIKRLSLLRQAMPSLRRVAVLSNHRQGVERSRPPLRAAATSAGVDLAEIWVENSPGDIPQAFEAVRSGQVEAIMVVPTPELHRDVGVIVGLATIARVASIGGTREDAKAGLLIGYGPNRRELILQAADYVGRILKGAHPGDLPFQGPARFDLAVNLKTARTLGLDLPPPLRESADEVFE